MIYDFFVLHNFKPNRLSLIWKTFGVDENRSEIDFDSDLDRTTRNSEIFSKCYTISGELRLWSIKPFTRNCFFIVIENTSPYKCHNIRSKEKITGKNIESIKTSKKSVEMMKWYCMEISERLIFFVVLLLRKKKGNFCSSIVYAVTIQWIYEYAGVSFPHLNSSWVKRENEKNYSDFWSWGCVSFANVFLCIFSFAYKFTLCVP